VIALDAPARPPLRYFGGKWRLAPWILRYVPEHRIYVEPFGGGGSVLLRKKRAHAEIYNDIDAEVVNVFRQLQDPAANAQLLHRLRHTLFSRREFLDAYRPHVDDVDRAYCTIVRSHLGYGAQATSITKGRVGFRTNSNRAGTTPAREWAHYPQHLASFCTRLAGVVYEEGDGIELLSRIAYQRPDALIYCDPPYPHITRQRSDNYRYEMTDADHVRLAEALHAHAGMVLVSGYRCALYDELYGGWTRVATTSRTMRVKLGHKASAVESLWISPRAEESLRAHQPDLPFPKESNG
jgi:DNA adenine methylase